MSRFHFLPVDRVQGLYNEVDDYSLVELISPWIWLTAFILRRTCDKILEGCQYIFMLLQGSQTRSEATRESGSHSDTTRFSGRSGESSNATELLWMQYFDSPDAWWDNRVGRRNPRAPDFKRKKTKQALWIDSWTTPTWVKLRFLTVK